MHSWVVDACVLSADAALVLLFYGLHKSKTTASDLVKSAESFSIDENLAASLQSRADHKVAYASVHGTVEPADGSQLLTSKYTSGRGVIRRWTFDELKSKYINESWSDYSDFKSGSEEIPFCLQGNVAGSVVVEDGSRATMLEETLTLTHDHFTPRLTRPVRGVVDQLEGRANIGIRDTERMLKAGTALLGFGELALEHGQVRLRAPTHDSVRGAAYILTRRSKDEVLAFLGEPAWESAQYLKLAKVFCSYGFLYIWVLLGRHLYKMIQSCRQCGRGITEVADSTGVEATDKG